MLPSSRALKKKRNLQIAQKVIAGGTYDKIAKQSGLSKRQIGRILTKPEIKDVIETGLAQMITKIPIAVDVVDKTLKQAKDASLRYRASQDVLKIAAIIPSNVQNQTVHNVYNIQNNQVLNPGVSKALSIPNLQDDPDTIDI